MHPKANEKDRTIFLEKIFFYSLKGKNIVYLDESGFYLDAPRIYGYAKRGDRCLGKHNWNERSRINAI